MREDQDMCGKEEDEGDQYYSRLSVNSNIQGYQEQFRFQQQQQLQHQHLITGSYGGEIEGRDGLSFSHLSPTLSWSLPPVHLSANPVPEYHPFLVPPPPSYTGLFNRPRASSSLQFSCEGPSSSLGPAAQPGSSSFVLQAELGKMTSQEIMDAKAVAASKSHSEAERRRRAKINNHYARLRSLLPNTTKTDKASLLAEVIQHVKELKRQTSEIAEDSPVPSEVDELTVDASDDDGKFIIKASLCCEDRSDLLPDLNKTLKDLRLRTLKAEITALGGRVRNVLFITGEDESNNSSTGQQQQQKQKQLAPPQYSVSCIYEALKAVMDRRGGDESSSGSIKRQRTNFSVIEHR